MSQHPYWVPAPQGKELLCCATMLAPTEELFKMNILKTLISSVKTRPFEFKPEFFSNIN